MAAPIHNDSITISLATSARADLAHVVLEENADYQSTMSKISERLDLTGSKFSILYTTTNSSYFPNVRLGPDRVFFYNSNFIRGEIDSMVESCRGEYGKTSTIEYGTEEFYFKPSIIGKKLINLLREPTNRSIAGEILIYKSGSSHHERK